VHRGGSLVDLLLEQIVPGVVVQLAGGAIIPSDLPLIASKELHVDQSALSGEVLPVDKRHEAVAVSGADLLHLGRQHVG
jgi:P-type Mg2+ transporter